MARRLDKERVLKMRIEQEMSYSEIKAITGIAKGTLSGWLAPYPLSAERIRELGPNSERRIENCRNSKRLKKEARLKATYTKAAKEIGMLTKRERFIGGIFLYWGEGDKTHGPSVSNTDPGVIKFFISWLVDFGFNKNKLYCRLDLYKDMDIEREVSYWSNITGINQERFRVYIKRSNLADITYKNGFGHGTCKVILYKKPLFEYISMCLKYLRGV